MYAYQVFAFQVYAFTDVPCTDVAHTDGILSFNPLTFTSKLTPRYERWRRYPVRHTAYSPARHR